MDSTIQKLLLLIGENLGWGDAALWQSRDFEKLSALVFEKTGVKLSDSTLKRVWGRVSYQSAPSITTLDTLAQFAGFEHWRAFVMRQMPVPLKAANVKNPRRWHPVLIASAFALILVLAFSMLFLVKQPAAIPNPSGYSFSSKRLTRTIPASVIFSYDASDATDSVFIRYRWDKSEKTPLDKNAHTYTTIHYEPGCYHPELLVGGYVVKTHDYIIPTNGWLGWIVDGYDPAYLDSAVYHQSARLDLPVARMEEKVPSPEITPPYVRYYNVGNFGNIPVSNFSFEAQVKSNYNSGAAACRFISVQLITDGAPVVIPLSAKGCVSDLNLVNFDQVISGKLADLSGFGTDVSSWVSVSCRATSTTIQYLVDGRLAFEAPLPALKTNIVGIGFSFQGTGAVRQVLLKDGGKTAFKDFYQQ